MFCENLNKYLELAGWRKIDLARAAKIRPESISRWNDDRFCPSRTSLMKIKKALNAEFKRQRKPIVVSIDSLLSNSS